MSTRSPNWSLEFANNPLNIQQRMLERFEEYADGDFIADPNNVVSFVMEMFSELTADATSEMDKTMQTIYPSRAQNTSDLYKHMSDYDYVNLFSSPASAILQISLDKTYLMRNAISFGNYKKVVIPKSTKITIGSHTFGLYYPVEIRINPVSETFSIVYDTTTSNPLYPIQNNVLEHSFRQYENLKLLYIQLPVWQFETKVHTEELISGTGFNKTLSYTNKFYAIRCFAETYEKDDGAEEPTWDIRELSLALNNQTYDHTKPTAVFTVLPESQTCKVNIPYVYFTENLIRGALRIEIYTTEGELNFTIPTNTTEYCALGFFTDDISDEEAIYAEPLRTIPAIAAVPMNTVIKGGSNGMSYSKLRDCVIHDTFSDKPLQTPDDINAYWDKKDYITTLYRDGITDRIFLTHAKLTDATGAIIGAATIGTQFNVGKLEDYSTIQKNSSVADTYTILPQTIYRFDEESGTCIPLTTAEMLELDDMTPSKKVDAYNSNNYTISPYHLQICVKGKYPTTITYDLRDPKILSREFIGENQSTATQLTVYGSKFSHDLDSKRYELDIAVGRTDDLKDIEAVVEATDDDNETYIASENFIVVIEADTIYDKQTFAKATYLSRSGDLDLFTLRIDTLYELYQVSNKHGLGIVNTFKDVDGTLTHVFALDTSFRILLCCKKNIISESEYQITKVDTELPVEYSDYTVLSEHKLTVRFGEVINELDQRMSLSYDKSIYDTYPTTKFNVLDHPIYARNPDGSIMYTMNDNGSVELTELYAAGTITMITEEVDVEVTLNEGNITGYYGRTFTYKDDGGSHTVVISQENADTLKNKTGFVKARRTPRFNITSAFSDTSDDAAVIGSYECLNPTELGALSGSHDIWKMNKTTDANVTDLYDEYQVKAVDAALLALKLATVVTSHADLPTTGLPGTFIFVTNDGTDATVPVYGFLKSSGVDDSSCRARLYTWTSTGWTALLGGENITTMRNTIKALNRGDTAQDNDGLEIPTFCGYAYVLEMSYNHLETNHNRISEIDNIGDVVYVSWLTTATLPGIEGDVTKYVSFAQCKTVEIENGEVSGSDMYWKNNINQWPWDVTNWLRIRTAALYKASDSVNPIQVKQLLTDEVFGISFDAQGSSKYCQYITGQLKLDSNGQPIETNTRDIVYLIDMLQLDAKLAIATTSNYSNYPSSVCDIMRTYFDDIGEAKPKLFPNSRIFFEPLKSFGYGTFTVNGSTEDYPLDITMGFRLHVSKVAAEDLTMLDVLKQQVIAIIDAKLSQGIVNCADIANEITSTISDSVLHVDVLGINGDQNLQTMTCTDTNVRPHLKHILKLLDDGTTIDVERGLDLEIVVSD